MPFDARYQVWRDDLKKCVREHDTGLPWLFETLAGAGEAARRKTSEDHDGHEWYACELSRMESE